MEALECRRLLAELVVDNLGDLSDGDLSPGQFTLREAIEQANLLPGADAITFADSLSTVEAPILVSTEMLITESLAINWPASNQLTLDAQGNSRIFNINDGNDGAQSEVSIGNLILTGGVADYGGAILTAENLTVASCILTLNRSTRDANLGSYFGGGAIQGNPTAGSVTIAGSTISNNTSAFQGGGVVAFDIIVLLSEIRNNVAAHGGGLGAFNTVSLMGSTVSGNTATAIMQGNYLGGNGGGVASYSSVRLTNSTISDNVASQEGGGIFAYSGTIELNDSEVSHNSAERGGGISSTSGTVTLTSSTVSGNTAKGDIASGGGIYAKSSSVTLTSSTLSENIAEGYFGGSGGGISAYSGSVTITNSTLHKNRVAGSMVPVVGGSAVGGGISANSGLLTITRSTLSENSAEGEAASGGGIFAISGPLTLTNSTLSGNRADGSNPHGGGISTTSGTLTIVSSTLSGNSIVGKFGSGGGVFVSDTNANPQLTIHNSMVAGNRVVGGSTGPDIVPDLGGDLVIDYSLIGDTFGSGITETTGTGNRLDVDPQLGPLADNGGPTQTHAPLPGSPAIGAGDPTSSAGVDGVPEFDQRGTGFPRVQRARIDMGSFESDLTPASWHNFDNPFDVDNMGSVVLQDVVIVINEIVLRQHSNPVDARLDPIATPPPFYDVDNNGFVTLSDANRIITEINTRSIARSPGGVTSMDRETAAIKSTLAGVNPSVDSKFSLLYSTVNANSINRPWTTEWEFARVAAIDELFAEWF